MFLSAYFCNDLAKVPWHLLQCMPRRLWLATYKPAWMAQLLPHGLGFITTPFCIHAGESPAAMQDEEEQMQDHVPGHGSNPNAKPSRMATLRQVSRGMIIITIIVYRCSSRGMMSPTKLHKHCWDPDVTLQLTQTLCQNWLRG